MKDDLLKTASISLPALVIVVLAIFLRISVLPSQTLVTRNAVIKDRISIKVIDREKALEQFFDKYNSPLAENSKSFIEVADKYNIDFRILPAISCMESSCGKKLIPESYNPFGWGIYGNNIIRFSNYNEAIEKVGEGLNKQYFAKGLDSLEKIAPVYTPPKYNHWLSGVTYFVKEIDKNSINVTGSTEITYVN